MAITNFPSTFSASLQVIHPTLQAAAQRMSGEEFNEFTHQVRFHYETRTVSKLADLFRGRDIRPSMESARQLIFARMHAFDEPPPIRLPKQIRQALTGIMENPHKRMIFSFVMTERVDWVERYLRDYFLKVAPQPQAWVVDALLKKSTGSKFANLIVALDRLANAPEDTKVRLMAVDFLTLLAMRATPERIQSLDQAVETAQAQGASTFPFAVFLEKLSENHRDPSVRETAKEKFAALASQLLNLLDLVAGQTEDLDLNGLLGELTATAERRETGKLHEIVYIFVKCALRIGDLESLGKLTRHPNPRVRFSSHLVGSSFFPLGYDAGMAWTLERSLVENDLSGGDPARHDAALKILHLFMEHGEKEAASLWAMHTAGEKKPSSS